MKKTARPGADKTVVDVWRRELGDLSSRNFSQGLGASEFDLRTAAATELFTCQPIDARRKLMKFMPVQLKAITIDPRHPNLFVVAGSHEYTQLYDICKYSWNGSSNFGQPAEYFCPPHLIGDQRVGITALAFSEQSELLVSYNDEFIYLVTREMGLAPNSFPSSPVSTGTSASEVVGMHPTGASSSAMDVDEKTVPQAYKGHRCETVKGVNFFGPQSEYVVSGSNCGRIFIWKKKGRELIRVIEGADQDIVNCIESHPHTMVLASSGIDHDIKLWTPMAQESAKLPKNLEQQQPRAQGWMYHLSTPQVLMLQLFSLQRQRNSPDGANAGAGQRELLALLFAFSASNDGSSDDGDTSSLDDL